jgi:hypothetical protein
VMPLSFEKRSTCGRCKGAAAMSCQTVDSWGCDQAASFPDALATWVAIASIKAGDRQS